jgi:hypothetical protein
MILPSGRTARASMISPPTWTLPNVVSDGARGLEVRLPDSPSKEKDTSSVPSGFRRTMSPTLSPSKWANFPAARILPSGWMASAFTYTSGVSVAVSQNPSPMANAASADPSSKAAIPAVENAPVAGSNDTPSGRTPSKKNASRPDAPVTVGRSCCGVPAAKLVAS